MIVCALYDSVIGLIVLSVLSVMVRSVLNERFEPKLHFYPPKGLMKKFFFFFF